MGPHDHGAFPESKNPCRNHSAHVEQTPTGRPGPSSCGLEPPCQHSIPGTMRRARARWDRPSLTVEAREVHGPQASREAPYDCLTERPSGLGPIDFPGTGLSVRLLLPSLDHPGGCGGRPGQALPHGSLLVPGTGGPSCLGSCLLLLLPHPWQKEQGCSKSRSGRRGPWGGGDHRIRFLDQCQACHGGEPAWHGDSGGPVLRGRSHGLCGHPPPHRSPPPGPRSRWRREPGPPQGLRHPEPAPPCAAALLLVTLPL